MQIEEQNPFASHPKAIILGVCLGPQPLAEVEEHLDELADLIEAAGGRVVGRAVQRRRVPDIRTFIGRGKVEEVTELAEELEVSLLIFDDDLTPTQVKVLEKETGCAVMDRSSVILEIFHQRARTREARTQVELARFRYLLPRLTRQWSHLSRQAGGIGVRGGEGESQLEADRRILRSRIKRLEKQLVGIERSREVQRRGRRGTLEIALAGYTNAGKSTLFNRLTGDTTLVRDQVFATLDARLRRGHLVRQHVAVYADTVGFIRKLPHHLVASFRSTLSEVAEADLVIHLVDGSHPGWQDQQQVGDSVLRELGVDSDKIVLVYNKVDQITEGAGLLGITGLWISATSGEGIEALKQEMARRLGVAPAATEPTEAVSTAGS